MYRIPKVVNAPKSLILAGFAGILAFTVPTAAVATPAGRPAPVVHAVAPPPLHLKGVSRPPAVHHKPAPTHHETVKHHVVHIVLRHHKAITVHSVTVGHGHGKPYMIYDTVTPWALPAKVPAAVYATGPYRATPGQVAGRQSQWIDTTGHDPHASTLDVEPGDATPGQAAGWAAQRLATWPHATARVYTTIGLWASARAAIDTLSRSDQHRVKWWIADPTGVPHLVPGSDATQWSWGKAYDISEAKPDFAQGSQ